MNNNIKRSLFLMYFESDKPLSVIAESVDNLFESRQTEMAAINFFKNSGVDKEGAIKLIERFRIADQTKNKVLTLPMAISYVRSGNLAHVLNTFKKISELINANKIPMPIIDKPYISGEYHIGNKTFKEYEAFSDYINNMVDLATGYGQWKSNVDIENDATQIFPRTPEEEKTGIVIYDGNDVGKCIKYGMGGITGQHYKFCISRPRNTYWQTYRDEKGSTFYFVFDKTRDFDDPLHLMVVNRTNSSFNDGYEIVDANNHPNNIAEFGDDILKYIEYLQKRGVPTEEIFINKPKTQSEEEEFKKLGSPNSNLIWFKNLSFVDKTKYIGRGHILTYEQFKYLWDHRKTPGGFHLLKQYLNMGEPLSEDQFNLLTSETGEGETD